MTTDDVAVDADEADDPPPTQAIAATKPGVTQPKPRLRRVLSKTWLVVLIAAVGVLGTFGVLRIRGLANHDAAGTSPPVDQVKPITPKFVQYDVDGPPGSIANINYFDLNTEPQRLDDVALPWTLKLSTTAPGAFASILAQGTGETIGCRVTVDGVVRNENSASGVNALTFCVVKSA